MNKMFLFLGLVISMVAFADEAPKPCILLDKDFDSKFMRCQTNEVVCYLSKAGQQCWPIQPAPTPSPSPAPKKK